jgi:hypothetical protein
MAAAVGQLGHDVSTDIVGLLSVVSYVGIRRVTYHGSLARDKRRFRMI